MPLTPLCLIISPEAVVNDTDRTLQRHIVRLIARAGFIKTAHHLAENVYRHASADDEYRAVCREIELISLDPTPLDPPYLDDFDARELDPIKVPRPAHILCAYDIAADPICGLLGFLADVLEEAGRPDLATPILRLIIQQWRPTFYHKLGLPDLADTVDDPAPQPTP